MSLRNKISDHLDLVSELARAPEFQIRLQAISVSSEILAKAAGASVSGLSSKEELRSLCDLEKQSQVKRACHSFLSLGQTVKK